MKKEILFISDCHGKWDKLNQIIQANQDRSLIQLGDLGIGFPNYPCPDNFGDNFKFIRGNHDNPQVCREHPNYLGDFGIWNEIFFISGAYSIDHHLRTEGIDWWEEEQLSYSQLQNMIDLYLETRPKYVITHDCPENVCCDIHSDNKYPSKTQQALQVCLDNHSPEKWIFGHHHIDYKKIHNKTEFICMKELGTHLLVY